MEETQASLTCRWRGWTRDFLLTDGHLVWKYRRGRRSGEKRALLKDLSASPVRVTGRPRHVGPNIVGGGVCVTLSSILFFSSVQSHVPLLAPCVALVGIFTLSRVVRDFRIQTWTSFFREDGTWVASILHRGCDDEERERFEAAFSQSVSQAKRTS